MAHFRGHQGDSMTVLYVLYISLLAIATRAAPTNESWYVGCYNNTAPGLEVPYLLTRSPPTDALHNPVSCSRECKELGYGFMCISKNGCGCLTKVPGASHIVSSGMCNYKCDSFAKYLSCGSEYFISVYLSRGPYLERLSVEGEAPVYMGQRVAIHVTAELASALNVSTGIVSADVDPGIISIDWKTRGQQTTDEVHVSDGDFVANTAWVTYFDEEGNYSIEVHVSNGLSWLSTHVNLTVLLPMPANLELSVITSSEDLPSCLPTRQGLDNADRAALAFKGEPIVFEASVRLGINLTFHWLFSDDIDSPVTNSYDEHCSSQECRVSIQNHTFESLGQQEVSVSVGNAHAILSEKIYVVVLERAIQDVTFALKDEQHQAVTPGSPVQFLVAMVSPSRQTTTLEFHPGDGIIKQYSFKELNRTGSNVADLKDGASVFHLLSGYGDGCQLTAEMQYSFNKQGTFSPAVRIANGAHRAIHQPLGKLITVQNQLIEPILIHPQLVAVNQAVDFTASFLSVSPNTSFHWTVSRKGDRGETISQVRDSTSVPRWQFSFPDTDTYHVQLVAKNMINSVSARSSLTAFHPVSGLKVEASAGPAVTVGAHVTFTGSVGGGNQVTFTWDFSDDASATHITRKETSSIATHTFHEEGEYKITMTASNPYNNLSKALDWPISVLEPVNNLVVKVNGAALTGNLTTFIALVSAGTRVQYEFIYDGRLAEGTVSQDREMGLLNVGTWSHAFRSSGVKKVKVRAYNDVSEVRTEVEVVVQDEVPRVQIHLPGIAVKGEYAVLTVRYKGKLLEREDTVVEWKIDREIIKYTQAPVTNFLFSQAKIYNITVTISNLVSQDSVSRNVSVEASSSEPRFNQTVTTAVGEPISFYLVSLPAPPLDIHVNYGDNNDNTEKLTSGDECRWQHTYNSIGVFTCQASPAQKSDPTSSKPITTVISVQQPITSLVIEGPSAVPIHSISKQYTWTAGISSGTNVIYNWTVGSGFQLITTHNQLVHEFTKAGNYQITVTALNGLDIFTDTRNVIVQYPINHLKLTTRPVVHGNPSRFELVVTGGQDIILQLHFGDGNSTTIKMSDPSVSPEELESPTDGKPGKYRCRLEHWYGSVGEHTISINASNKVSWKEISEIAFVAEPITGVKVESESPRVILADEIIVVKASVQTGTDLVFQWNFFDDGVNVPQVNSSGRVSVARHTYVGEGIYNVQVLVSNNLYQTPMEGYLPFNFTVCQPITDTVFVLNDPADTKANLLRDQHGNTSTHPIGFTASAKGGENIKFLFDFGDGTIELVDGEQNFFRDLEADVEHSYRKKGEYTARVTYINACGNTTLLLSSAIYVQFAPEDLKLDSKVYNTQLGNATTFQASVSAGVDIHFDWDLGDGNLRKDAGSTMTHTYRLARRYIVTVTAYNHVGTQTVQVTVNVQELIQGVRIEVSSPTVVTNTPITFSAVTEPRTPSLVEYFEWDFGEKSSRSRSSTQRSFDGRITYVYKRAGKYVVNVKAFNILGEALSEPVQVHVVDPISDLTIDLLTPDAVVNKPMKFLAHHYQGSDVTYFWNFGDGHMKNTSEFKVEHSYNKTAELYVRVVAANPVSSKSAQVRLFVLHSPCRPPEITILGAKNAPRLIKKSQALKIEADVKINCSITSQTVYSWSIHNQTSQNITFDLTDGDRPVFRDPILYFNTKVLPYGDYFVELEVIMNNTIVYANKRANFSIIASELQPVITGGLQRIASRQEDVIMDGSASTDPDEPQATDFSYLWECSEFAKPDKSCFIDDDSAPILGNQSQISVPGRLFKANVNSFAFNLTVSRPNRTPSTTTQVVDLQSSKLLDVSVSCQQCKEGGLVNADAKLALTAEFDNNLLESELIFTWTMFIVADGNDLAVRQPAGAHNSGQCVAADGTTYWSYMHPDTNESSTEEPNARLTSTTALTDTTKGGETSTSKATSTRTTSTTTTTWPAAGGWAQPVQADEVASGGRGSGRGSRDSVPHAEPAAGFGLPVEEGDGEFDFNPREDAGGGRTSSALGPGMDFPVGEALPGEAGSSSGRQDRGGVYPEERAGSGPVDVPPVEGEGGGRGYGSGQSGSGSSGGSSDDGRGTQGGSFDPWVDGINPHHMTPHIVMKSRRPRYLGEQHTLTGTKQRTLVIKPGILHQNRTYILQVNISHPGTRRYGKALIYVVVNESPTMGSCTLTPPLSVEAIEMETEFKIFCHDWRDEESPIRYEVSYNKNDKQPRDLVYQGFNNQVSFQLPAGDPTIDYKLKVHIAIIDALGARTDLCSIPVTVLQKSFDTSNQTEEQILYDLVEEDGSDLQTYVDKGDSRNARLHAQMVADRLNRLSNNEVEKEEEKSSATRFDSKGLRRKIRRAMLWTLKDLPMRDQYEIHQTASAVSASTAVVDELNIESLGYASTILDLASKEMRAIAFKTSSINTAIASVSIQGMSNVLSAVQKVDVKAGKAKVKQIVESTTQALQKVLQAELTSKVTGEEPINMTTQNLYAYAGRYKTSTIPVIQSDAAKFQLPGNLENYLDEKDSRTDCYEAQVINFKENPYLYGHSDKSDIQTDVTSLTLFSCDGNELDIKDLENSKRVEIEIPHRPIQDDVKQYILYKHQMNIHKFNLSSDRAQQSLHIDVQLIPPDAEGRVFSIAILLRAHAQPDPENYQSRWTFPGDQTNISVFIPPGSLNGSTTYYVGIVDEFYNAGRPREGEIRERSYRLKLWWGQCLYWDESADVWSSAGCQIQSESSYYKAHCACNHLTSFGAHFSLAPNDIDFTNLEDFFNLSENPVTFSLIAAVICAYLIALIICIRLDKYDELKGKPVHLIDNSPHDIQKYIVTLETGFRKNAGTTAKVSIVLHGDKGMSETRELVPNTVNCSQQHQPLFERNSRDTFVISLPENLGRVFKVQIWHNNAGARPSWYLSRCIVRDVIRGETSYFVCEKWFAVEEEDGKIEREIMRTEHGLGFTATLWAKGTQYFADFHLWFGMISRPSYSSFTRAQRLTCCLSLLMSYMAVNAAWYRQTEKEYRGEFGLIDVSWRAVTVGVITSLMVLPPNLLLVLLFRRSKRRTAIDGELPEEKYKLDRKESISSVESSVVRMLQPVMTPSIFDQSVLNWQNVQDWAQRKFSKRNSESQEVSTADIKAIPTGMEMPTPPQDETGLELVRSPQDPETGTVMEGELSTPDTAVPIPDVPDPAASPELMPPKDVIVPAPPWERSSDSDNSMQTPPPTLRRQHRREGSGPEPPPRPSRPAPPRAMIPLQPLVRQSSGSSQASGNSQASMKKGPPENVPPDIYHQSASRQPSTSSQADSISYEHQGAKPKTRVSSTNSTADTDPCSVHSSADTDPCSLPSMPSSTKSTDTDPCSLPSMPSTAKSTPRSVRSDWSSKSYKSRSERVSDYSSSSRSRDGVEWRRRSQRCYLPYGCQFVAWVLASLIILGCAAVTVLYGFHFGRTKSILWLQSLFFAFLQCAFITHPILIIIISVYTAVRYRDDLSIFGLPEDIANEERSLLNTTKSSMSEEEEEFDQAKGIAARQRSRYLRFVRPPQEKQLIEARSKTIKEKKAASLMHEIGLFLLQFVLLIFVAFGKSTRTSYSLSHSLEVALARRGSVGFVNIHSVPHWWDWMERDFVRAVYHESNRRNTFSRHELRKIETSSLVGHINIRQLRVVNHSCDLPDKYQPSSHCRSFYTEHKANTSSYGPNKAWHHGYNGANGYQGRHGYYDNHGFVVLLNESASGARNQLKLLRKSDWIDRHTRAVALEFTLFHAPTSFFIAVRLLLEIPPFGGTTPTHQILPTSVYRYITAWDNFILACELLFIAATLIKTRFVIQLIVHSGKEFVKTPWNGLALLQALLSLMFCCCFVYRFLLVGDTVERLRATYHEVYVDVSHIYHWDQVLRCLVGFTLFLVTIQLLKALRHRKPFAVFTNVLRHASFDILVFGLMFIILISAYTSLGLAVWGTVTQQFSSLDLGLQTVLGMLTGHYFQSDLDPSHHSSSTLGWRLFIVSFLILATGSLTGYIIAILNFHYRVYKDEPIMAFSAGETARYYWELILRRLGLWFSEPPPEDENVLPPEFMIGEIQYQMEEMLFKMNALAGTSNLPEKPPMYFTDTDTDGTASSGGSEINRFERADMERERASKIDEINADAHLAQLIQLDSIGADVLSQGKKLRAQMQMEIFRQLQARRRGSDGYPSSGSEHVVPYYSRPSSGSRRDSGSISREGSQRSVGSSSGGSSPRQHPFGSKLHHRLAFPKPPKLGTLFPTREEREGEDSRAPNSFTTVADVTPQAGGADSAVSPGDALILQDISDKGSSISDGLPMDDMSGYDVIANHENLRIVKRLLSETDFGPEEGASGNNIRTRSPYQPKPRQRIPSDTCSVQGYEDIVMNAYFSSEDDSSSYASSKCRTLRKTHSRGKGKGGDLRHCKTSIDLGIDNEAFVFDGEEGAARVHVSSYKQAWS